MDVLRLRTNTTPFYIKDLSMDFGIHGGPGTNPPRIPRDDCVPGLNLPA